ncbi:MAG: HD domain-containing protein [Firmicutes bacterium]|nr:HD domain-containing protein [Bacillota bacterium]
MTRSLPRLEEWTATAIQRSSMGERAVAWLLEQFCRFAQESGLIPRSSSCGALLALYGQDQAAWSDEMDRAGGPFLTGHAAEDYAAEGHAAEIPAGVAVSVWNLPPAVVQSLANPSHFGPGTRLARQPLGGELRELLPAGPPARLYSVPFHGPGGSPPARLFLVLQGPEDPVPPANSLLELLLVVGREAAWLWTHFRDRMKRQESEATAAALESLAEAVTGLTPSQILQFTVDAVAGLAGADEAAIYLDETVARQTGLPVVEGPGGPAGPLHGPDTTVALKAWRGMGAPRSKTPDEARPGSFPEAPARDALLAQAQRALESGEPILDPSFAALSISMSSGPRRLGVLQAIRRDGRPFSENQQRFLRSLAILSGASLGASLLSNNLWRLHTRTVAALAAAIDARDPYTRGHSQRVARYARRLAQALGWKPELVRQVFAAGLLHDIGKLAVPDHVLGKPGRLSAEEWEIVRTHPDRGVSIVGHVAELQALVPAIRHHHERFDGRGYPAGLKGRQIPVVARILAIADSFDAMTTSRPYRPGLTFAEAQAELLANAGTQFDPELVQAFVQLVPTLLTPSGRQEVSDK